MTWQKTTFQSQQYFFKRQAEVALEFLKTLMKLSDGFKVTNKETKHSSIQFLYVISLSVNQQPMPVENVLSLQL